MLPTRALLLLLLLLTTSCNDTGLGIGPGGGDLARPRDGGTPVVPPSDGGTPVVPVDLSWPPPPDLATRPGSECWALVDCYAGCADVACFDDCDATGSSAGITLLGDAIYCGQLHCTDVSMKCKVSDSGDRLLNMDGSQIMSSDPGTGLKACGACLDNALAGLFGGACPDSSSPDCNPAECADETAACLND